VTVTETRPDLSRYPRTLEPTTRYSDLDPSRRVGREALLRWFEDARLEVVQGVLRSHDRQAAYLAASVRLDVLAPLRINGQYLIGYGVTHLGTASVGYAYGVFDDDALVAVGSSTNVHAIGGTPTPLPDEARAVLGELVIPDAARLPRTERPASRRVRENYPFRYDVRTRFGDLDTFRHVNNVALAGWYVDGLAELHTDLLGYPVGGPLDGLSPSGLEVEYGGIVQYPGIYQLRVGVVDIDDSAVRYACGLFDGARCLGVADAVGAVRFADDEGRDIDLRAAFEPFRMRG